MSHCLVADIGLGNLGHRNGGLNSYLKAAVLKTVGNGKGIHSSCKHTDMVSSCSVHITAGASSPEVASSDNDTNLNSGIYALLDALSERGDNVIIKTGLLVSGERLTA